MNFNDFFTIGAYHRAIFIIDRPCMFTLRHAPTRTTRRSNSQQQSPDNYLFTAPLQLAARVSLYAMLVGAFGSSPEVSSPSRPRRSRQHY
ncbi:hypothetical protein OL229_00665 [Neisseriaceae bacterium JH1-16]|nr:hypothetical protein [Neisseriaceae bacterium JH1-16]